MEKVHIRNIFRVFVPLDVSLGSGTAQPKQEPFGLEYIQKDLVLHFNIRILCTDGFGNTKYEPKGSLTWAKRTPMVMQQRTPLDNSNGLFMRLKVNQGVFDFRKTKDRLFQIVVELVENGSVKKTGTSTAWELFPKKRQFSAREEGENEAVVPIFWMGEDGYLIDNQQQNITPESLSLQSIQDSPLDDSPIQMSYHQNEPANLFPPMSFPADAYDMPNMNLNNDNYMVLYNGNAEVVGNFRALNFYKASDVNIKQDIRLLDQARDCRKAMLQINGVDYKFKKGITQATNKRFIGYIAQQIESVVPEAVQLIDGILHVDYESLIPYLSESMKQNYNDVQSVTSEVFQIKHVLDTLYERFTAGEKKQDTTEQSQTKLSRRMKHVIGWTAGVLAFSAVISVAILWVFLWFITPSHHIDLTPVIVLPSDIERTSLEAVFRAILSPDDERLQEKSLKKPYCTWEGVTCADKITALFLTNSGRKSGANSTAPFIHEAIGNFAELRHLALDYNGLTSTIPESMANLTKLQDLSLQNNRLTGTVPDLTALTELNVLDISNNMLNGSLETLLSIPALQRFTANSNQFNTQLPEIISTSLVEISMSNCQLYGPISSAWALNHWTVIILDRNNLTGSVPCFGTSLHHLNLEKNNLDGEFCSFTLTTISAINLADNKLTGALDLPNMDLTVAQLNININNNSFSSFFPSAMNVTEADNLVLGI